MRALLRGSIAVASAVGMCLAAVPSATAAHHAQRALSAAHDLQRPLSAAHDTQPPVLTTPVKATFIVGSKIGQFRDTQDHNAYYDVPMRLSWTATDNVDTELNYDVWEYPQGAEPNRVGDFITVTTLDVVASDYDGSFGGAANVIDRWGVQAYDDAGNSTARTVFGAHLFVRQDDPTLHTVGSAAPTKAKGLRYAGQWAVATCKCYADKSTHHTRAKGASVAMTIDVAPGEDVSRLALVMDQGPRHGKARIRIDGTLRGTVDTAADTATHRRIVWTTSLRAGMHTVRIVNLATQGRPRIDFDAVVLN
jgi:hypothetical protein